VIAVVIPFCENEEVGSGKVDVEATSELARAIGDIVVRSVDTPGEDGEDDDNSERIGKAIRRLVDELITAIGEVIIILVDKMACGDKEGRSGEIVEANPKLIVADAVVVEAMGRKACDIKEGKWASSRKKPQACWCARKHY